MSFGEISFENWPSAASASPCERFANSRMIWRFDRPKIALGQRMNTLFHGVDFRLLKLLRGHVALVTDPELRAQLLQCKALRLGGQQELEAQLVGWTISKREELLAATAFIETISPQLERASILSQLSAHTELICQNIAKWKSGIALGDAISALSAQGILLHLGAKPITTATADPHVFEMHKRHNASLSDIPSRVFMIRYLLESELARETQDKSLQQIVQRQVCKLRKQLQKVLQQHADESGLLGALKQAQQRRRLLSDERVIAALCELICRFTLLAIPASGLVEELRGHEPIRTLLMDELNEQADISTYLADQDTLLHRCWLESVRLHPPTPLTELYVGDKELKLEDHSFPAGCRILISTRHSLRSDADWLDPHAFNPHRYQPGATLDSCAFGTMQFDKLLIPLAELWSKALVCCMLKRKELW